MPGRHFARGLNGVLLLLPAVAAALVAVHLTRSSWPAAAARGEPVVTALIGERMSARALGAAVVAMPLDFPCARDLAEHERAAARRDGWTETSLDLAWRRTLEAARRAPSDAETRFHLSGLAWRRGDPEAADLQARAALRLAPLYKDLRRRVALWFAGRYEKTRDPAHLASAVAASGEGAERLVAGLVDDPRMTRDEIRAAFAAARVPVARQVAYLEGVGRWDGAIEVAREAGPELEAAVRVRLAEYLLRTNRREAAFRQVLSAHELHPEAVTDDLLLGRALLEEGNRGPALGALERHLKRSGDVAGIEAVLAVDGVSAAHQRSLWASMVESGRGGDRARFALARAAARERDLVTAHRILRELSADPKVGAEACFELARAHRQLGDRRVALRYAREAAERDPRNERYGRLLREIERGSGR